MEATVLGAAVWPPGSLRGQTPPVPPDQTLYSLKLDIHRAEPEGSSLSNLARPGTVVEAFSDVAVAVDAGTRISATLRLMGDTRDVRWWIFDVAVLP